MKHIKIMALGILISLFPAIVKGQIATTIVVKAVVQQTGGKPLSGVTISSAVDDVQAISDASGRFILEVTRGSLLSVSAAGYEAQTVKADTALATVVLAPNTGFVQVAFKRVESKDLLGGISSYTMPGILDKNYITYSLDGAEAFAAGFHGNIWGMDNYLVLVDGVPRDLGNVLPTEIDQVTFLKGVSAIALYGSRAAKGVVSITTKRGKEEHQKINVRLNSGLNVPVQYPEYLGSAEYMTLYNEALGNDGLVPLYTSETIYNYAAKINKYRYPDVDYYSSEYLNKSFSRYDVTAEISGGTGRAKYYSNIGYWSAGSLLNFGEGKDHGQSDRFNIRGNVDVRLGDYINVKVDATAIFYSTGGVNTDYWGSAATLRPYRFAPLIPIDMIDASDAASLLLVRNSNHIIDGKYLLGGTQLDQTTPFASIYGGGYTTNNTRQFQFSTGISADLRNVLKGLTFSTNFAVDYANSYNQAYYNNYAVYEPIWTDYAGTGQVGSLNKYGVDSKSGVQNINGSSYKQTLAASAQLNYRRSYNDSHHFSAMLLANGFQQSTSAVYHSVSNANLGFQADYNYRQRYYLDFTAAMPHSARLPDGKRKAFSPTLSAGWRLSEEPFLKGSAVVDDLKITASAGILHTDLDINDYYLYDASYTQTNGAWFGWRDAVGTQSTDSRRASNPNLTYAKRKELNFGLQASLFKNLLNIEGTIFWNSLNGNVIQPLADYPVYFSTGWPVTSFIPYVNYNNDSRRGYDFSVKVNQRIAEIDWSLGIAGTYYHTKATKRSEVYEDSYQYRKGKPIDAIWGLQNAGFFMDDADIAASPQQAFGEVKPGDIKYIDQNGDNLIDSRDEVYLGRYGWYGSPLTLGINLTASWKNFTFFVLGTGRFGAEGMKNNSYYWIDGNDKYSAEVRNRWTPETRTTATYPRLTTFSSDNNFRASDFWLYSANRFDLSKVQLSYKFPEKMLKSKLLHELGVYASGFNLLTIAKEKDILQTNIGSSPQLRMYNLGLKALF